MKNLSKIAGWVFICYTILVILLSTYEGYTMVGKSFPGFLMGPEGGVGASVMPHWQGAKLGMAFPAMLVEADGMRLPHDYYKVIYNLENNPAGTPIIFKAFLNPQKGIKEVTIPLQKFEFNDFLSIHFAAAVLSLALLVPGIMLFASSQNEHLSWGVLMWGAGLGLLFNSANGQNYFGLPVLSFLENIDPFGRMFFYAFQMIFTSAGAYTYHAFLVLYEEPKYFAKKRIRYLYFYAVSLIMVLVGIYAHYSRNYGLYNLDWGYFHLLYTGSSLLFAAYITIRTRYKCMVPILRQRAKMMMYSVGTVMLLSFGFVFGNIGMGISMPYAIVFFPAVLIPITMTYGIMRSNLFEVNEIIKRTILYGSVVAVSGIFYAALFILFSRYFSFLPIFDDVYYNLTFMIVVIFLLNLIKHPIQNTIDRMFFKTRVDFNKVNDEIKHNIATVVENDKIAAAADKIFIDSLNMENAEILLYDEEKGLFRSQKSGLVLKKEEELAALAMEEKRLLSHNEIMVSPKYLPIRNRALAQMARIESRFILPFYFKDEIRGIIALGDKRSAEESFDLQDMELLHFLALQISVAFENARLYHAAENAKREVEKLNEILEEKVRIRTAELEARAKELEASNEYIAFITHNKTSFLASMSHELRTPLNGIIGFSDMAVEGVYGEINPVAKDVLKDLAFNGRELLQLINDILDLSKIEAGKMDIKMEDYSPRDAVDVAMGGWMNECEKKGIKVETEYAPDLPLGWGEEKRVKQVLDTLLRNAVRWSQTKRITIRVTRAPEKKVLLFEVEDYGVGIEAYRMPKLFVEHEYPQILNLQYYKNVGVGLALSKKWAELHGGTMWAESTEGKGSKFSFTMPLKEFSAQNQEAGTLPAGRQGGRRQGDGERIKKDNFGNN